MTETFLIDIVYFVISYLAVILIGFGLGNFMTHGFLITFIRVKASRGRAQLLIVNETTTTRYKVGKIEDGHLLWKGENKKQNRCAVDRSFVKRIMGVDGFELDSEGKFVKPDFSVAQGYDHQKTENLLIRCLTGPKTEDVQMRIVIFLLIVILLGLLFIGYISFTNSEAIAQLGTVASQTI